MLLPGILGSISSGPTLHWFGEILYLPSINSGSGFSQEAIRTLVQRELFSNHLPLWKCVSSSLFTEGLALQGVSFMQSSVTVPHLRSTQVVSSVPVNIKTLNFQASICMLSLQVAGLGVLTTLPSCCLNPRRLISKRNSK